VLLGQRLLWPNQEICLLGQAILWLLWIKMLMLAGECAMAERRHDDHPDIMGTSQGQQ
jgi:hypothetical protein